MDKDDVKFGAWRVSTKTGHNVVGYVVANTEHWLVLSPDQRVPGNETYIPTNEILRAQKLVTI